MADRSFSSIGQGTGQDVSVLKRHITIEVATIDDGDTITVDNYTTIDAAAVLDLADGTLYTVDLATNVITINDAAVSAKHIIVLVVGS